MCLVRFSSNLRHVSWCCHTTGGAYSWKTFSSQKFTGSTAKERTLLEKAFSIIPISCWPDSKVVGTTERGFANIRCGHCITSFNSMYASRDWMQIIMNEYWILHNLNWMRTFMRCKTMAYQSCWRIALFHWSGALMPIYAKWERLFRLNHCICEKYSYYIRTYVLVHAKALSIA